VGLPGLSLKCRSCDLWFRSRSDFEQIEFLISERTTSCSIWWCDAEKTTLNDLIVEAAAEFLMHKIKEHPENSTLHDYYNSNTKPGKSSELELELEHYGDLGVVLFEFHAVLRQHEGRESLCSDC